MVSFRDPLENLTLMHAQVTSLIAFNQVLNWTARGPSVQVWNAESNPADGGTT
jgi:hypothetical protein